MSSLCCPRFHVYAVGYLASSSRTIITTTCRSRSEKDRGVVHHVHVCPKALPVPRLSMTHECEPQWTASPTPVKARVLVL